jgi:hypothetical protein
MLITLQDWITKYEQEAEKLIIIPGFQCHYEPDKGFFYWAVVGDVFEIDHTCTNDITWAHDTAMQMAKVRLCRLLRTATHRNPAAYMRLTKGTPNLQFSGIRPNGKFYWVFDKIVN